MKHAYTNPVWGAPRKFSAPMGERKISWLELFYDLVYVVAIAKITQYFTLHPNFSGFLDYVYLFIMIFWGWVNGSMYYDLHGTAGIRTRLMTLWQMVAVAAMVVCLNSPQDKVMFRGTIAIMVMQVYITYLWWSVGIYDKEHRKLNKPYTICYLISLGLIFSTLFLHQPFVRVVFFASLFFNYLPPFYMAMRHKRLFSLSSSMTERLGLFTIIMFGEVVTGVINGATEIQEFSWTSWGNFVLALLIVFAMWWIFFALIADRPCKEGFLRGQVVVMLYIPLLMSLGMLGAAFAGIFAGAQTAESKFWVYNLFSFRIAIFLIGIALLANLLDYPTAYIPAKRGLQVLLVIIATVLASGSYLLFGFSLPAFFAFAFILLVSIIVVITRLWVKHERISAENSTQRD